MKKKLFIQAIVISFLFLALISVIVYWDMISWNKMMTSQNTSPPRRYLDLSFRGSRGETNFLQLSLAQFDSIFLKALYLLIIVQSIFLIRRLALKNAFLIGAWILSSLIGSFSIFMLNSFRGYLITGMNPYFLYVPIFFLVFQIVIWVYLNMFLFRKLAEVKPER